MLREYKVPQIHDLLDLQTATDVVIELLDEWRRVLIRRFLRVRVVLEKLIYWHQL